MGDENNYLAKFKVLNWKIQYSVQCTVHSVQCTVYFELINYDHDPANFNKVSFIS